MICPTPICHCLRNVCLVSIFLFQYVKSIQDIKNIISENVGGI